MAFSEPANRWWVYLLRCGDDSLYCGISNDLPGRLKAHQAGKGARYTRGRLPLQLVWQEPCADRSSALKREHAIKQLKRVDKLRLLAAAQGSRLDGAAHCSHFPVCESDHACLQQPQRSVDS